MLGKNFGISKSYASDTVYDVIFKASYILQTEYIKWMNVPNRITSTNIKNDDWPYLLGSLDATVQRINKPSKKQNDYYSGKHKCHVVKVQALVSPTGLLIYHTKYVPGKMHDFALFRKSELKKNY